jgi:nucleoside-diphosphate-sugar epimerase
VLVTGGAGFLGLFLIRALRDAGFVVRSFDVNPLEDPALAADVESRLGDVRDRAAARRAVEGCDFVVHSAALVPVTRARGRFWTVNVDGTRVVLEAALAAGVRHVVHVSSSAVYGTTSALPITESTWIQRGRPVFILGRGDNRYQLLAASDFSAACVLALRRAPGGDFNIGSREYATPREDLQAVIDHAGSRSRIRSVPPWAARAALQPLDALRLSPFVAWHYLSQHRPFYFDTAKAERELGFVPSLSNRAMLIDAYDWHVVHEATSGRSAHQRPLRRGLLRLLDGKR